MKGLRGSHRIKCPLLSPLPSHFYLLLFPFCTSQNPSALKGTQLEECLLESLSHNSVGSALVASPFHLLVIHYPYPLPSILFLITLVLLSSGNFARLEPETFRTQLFKNFLPFSIPTSFLFFSPFPTLISDSFFFTFHT